MLVYHGVFRNAQNCGLGAVHVWDICVCYIFQGKKGIALCYLKFLRLQPLAAWHGGCSRWPSRTKKASEAQEASRVTIFMCASETFFLKLSQMESLVGPWQLRPTRTFPSLQICESARGGQICSQWQKHTGVVWIDFDFDSASLWSHKSF